MSATTEGEQPKTPYKSLPSGGFFDSNNQSPTNGSQSGSEEGSDKIKRPEFEKRGLLSTIAAYFKLSFTYTWSDVTSRPRNFCIGFWSVFTVVFFVGLILLALSKTPVIFLRFAELTTGEMDVLILAEGGLPFINYTEVKPKIEAASSISGTTPRWLLKGEIFPFQNLTTPGDPDTLLSMSVNLIIIDSEHEKEIGVGRTWPYRQIGYGETQVYSPALRFIQTRPNIGQRMRLLIDIAGILEQQGVDLPLGAFDVAGANVTNATEAIRTAIGPNATEVNITIGAANFTLPVAGFEGALDAAEVAAGGGAAGGGFGSAVVTQFLSPELTLTTADAIEQTYAKYPAALGNVAILDFHDLVNLLLNQLCYETVRNPFQTLSGTNGAFTAPQTAALPSQTELQETLNLEWFTLVTVGMFEDRFETYYKSRKPRQLDVIKKSNELFLSLGVDFEGTVQYVVMSALSGFYFFELFLSSLFQSVAAVVAVLGAILVYTLLLTNSQERSFEMAILRSQGMFRSQLAHLMVTQSLVFIFPAVFCAMVVLVLINIGLELGIATFSAAPADLGRINDLAIAAPILFGFLVPMVANWGPTRSALFSSLRDALDVYRQTANETQVVALKLAELGLEPWQTMLGWFLVIIGFLIYYMVPFAFIFDQLWLFFLILNTILLGMLFGLCLISYSFEAYVERAVLWLLLWGPDKRLSTLIKRNLGSHKERNSKAYIMFTCSVACIIFAGVLFSLLSRSIGQTIQSAVGADVVLQSLSVDFPLNRSVIEEFLVKQKANGLVESFAFATFTLSNFPQITGNLQVSNFIGFPDRRQRVVGVDDTLLESTFNEFWQPTEFAADYDYPTTYSGASDAVKSMYDQPPSINLQPASRVFTGFPPNSTVPAVEVKYSLIIPCIMAEAGREVLGLSAGSSGTVSFDYVTGDGEEQEDRSSVFLFQPRALAKRFPGWPAISSLQFLFPSSTLLVPMSNFETLLKVNEIDFPTNFDSPRYTLPSDAIQTPQYERCFIRVNPNLKGAALTDFVNLLQSRVNPYYHIPIDTADIVNQLKTTADMIIYFFFFISAVCVILDTFMLWLTFVSNVTLNAWGFAVLRSLGFTIPQLVRSFIYEALAIVLSSFMVGTVIGVIIAFTLIVQMNLFLQLPVTFDFPWQLFIFLFCLSMISAVVGSWLPTRGITKRTISSVLKSGA